MGTTAASSPEPLSAADLPGPAGYADGLIRLQRPHPRRRGHPINHHVAGAATQRPADLGKAGCSCSPPAWATAARHPRAERTPPRATHHPTANPAPSRLPTPSPGLPPTSRPFAEPGSSSRDREWVRHAPNPVAGPRTDAGKAGQRAVIQRLRAGPPGLQPGPLGPTLYFYAALSRGECPQLPGRAQRPGGASRTGT